MDSVNFNVAIEFCDCVLEESYFIDNFTFELLFCATEYKIDICLIYENCFVLYFCYSLTLKL